MITRSGSGAYAAETLFAAPLRGMYAIMVHSNIGSVTGSNWLRLKVRVNSADPALVESNRSSVSSDPDAEANALVQMQRGDTISFEADKDVGVSNDPTWAFTLTAQLLGGPDLAVE